MDPRPISELDEYKAAGKLQGKVALITGGDSGLVALLRSYLQRGANVAIGYYDEHEDAEKLLIVLKRLA